MLLLGNKTKNNIRSQNFEHMQNYNHAGYRKRSLYTYETNDDSNRKSLGVINQRGNTPELAQ